MTYNTTSKIKLELAKVEIPVDSTKVFNDSNKKVIYDKY